MEIDERGSASENEKDVKAKDEKRGFQKVKQEAPRAVWLTQETKRKEFHENLESDMGRRQFFQD